MMFVGRGERARVPLWPDGYEYDDDPLLALRRSHI